MNTVCEDSVVSVYRACAVDEDRRCRNVICDLCFIGSEFQNRAVFENADILFIHAEALCHFLVEAEHTVFAVNGDEELRLNKGVEHHELVPVSVTGNVDVSQGLVDNVRALFVELVDHSVDRLFVARDRVSGNDDRVALGDVD